MDKRGLSHKPHGHDASGNADRNARLLELLAGALGVVGDYLRDRMRGLVLVRISGVAKRLDLLEFFAAKVVNLFVECQSECVPVRKTNDYKAVAMKQWSVAGGW